jgi:hypothetical protein
MRPIRRLFRARGAACGLRPAADGGSVFRWRPTKLKAMQTEVKPAPMPRTADAEFVAAVWSIFSG